MILSYAGEDLVGIFFLFYLKHTQTFPIKEKFLIRNQRWEVSVLFNTNLDSFTNTECVNKLFNLADMQILYFPNYVLLSGS